MVQSILHKCMFLFPYKEWNVQNKKISKKRQFSFTKNSLDPIYRYIGYL